MPQHYEFIDESNDTCHMGYEARINSERKSPLFSDFLIVNENNCFETSPRAANEQTKAQMFSNFWVNDGSAKKSDPPYEKWTSIISPDNNNTAEKNGNSVQPPISKTRQQTSVLTTYVNKMSLKFILNSKRSIEEQKSLNCGEEKNQSPTFK